MVLSLLILTAHHSVSDDNVENMNEFSNLEVKHASTQWGIDAINIPKLLTSHNPDALGIISADHASNDAHLIPQINEKQWAANNYYRVSSTQVSQEHENTSSMNVSFVKGRFSAETGLVTHSNDFNKSDEVYLQGAYSLFDGQQLNISFTAKIEAINENAINHYYGINDQLISPSSIFEPQATNTTLGLVSTYSVTKKWKILGLISSTNLDEKIENSPLINDNNVHMALIGTSYSF